MAELVSWPRKLSRAEPLLGGFSDEQRLRVRQALVRQAIHYVTRRLPPEAMDEGHRLGCVCAARWLDCPTDEMARDACIWAGGECWDGGVRYFDYPVYFLSPVFVLGATNLDEAARLAVETAPDSERHAAFFWQVAAVQAISRGESPRI